ncbi:MAG: ion transporter [Bdellovibrionaceae bacterium]|nr:ion transporter [Pseudobdellovibrionaceae bacterium]|tara:strand:- start:128089 stop:128895 length:807 start_codon:yes stop_codon:yes gene_type:complete
MTLKSKIHEIIFEAETPAGKLFDVALLWAIVLSVGSVMLESVSSLQIKYGDLFWAAEWIFTILFTIEYGLRVYSTVKPRGYIFSFYGMVDLLAILPTYLSLVFTGTHSLIVIRALRLLRVFRVLKLGRYFNEAQMLIGALRTSSPKITVFLAAVLSLCVIMGTFMYLIEGAENGFTSIPRSIYWTIVTMTTVGYGDIAPQTVGGQFLASAVMLLGYGILAVPTGIVSAEIASFKRQDINTHSCPHCCAEGHKRNAIYCMACGSELHPD